MVRVSMTRLAGLLTLVSSALFLLLALDLEITMLAPTYSGINRLLADAFDSGQFFLLATQSATQLCCATGLLALLLVQHNRMGQIAGGLALLGQILLTALNAPFLWLLTGAAIPPLFVNWLELNWKLVPLLAPLLGVVLMVYSSLPLRKRFFPRESASLLLLGGWMLLGGILSIYTLPRVWVALQVCSSCRYIPELPMMLRGELIGYYAFLMVLYLLWGCLGYVLWTKRRPEQEAPAAQAQPTPG